MLLATEIDGLEDRLRLQWRRVVGVGARRAADQRFGKRRRRVSERHAALVNRIVAAAVVAERLVPHAARAVRRDDTRAASARMNLVNVVAVIIDA